MSRNKLLQRSKVRAHFKNDDMDFIFQGVLGNGKFGVLNPGEAFYVASRITGGDPASWISEFRAYGERLDQIASRLEQQGWHQNAGETAMKAFSCYRAAVQFGSPNDAGFEELIHLFKSSFRRGAALLNLPLEVVRIPFEDKYLPGYFLPAEDVATHTPTLIVIGGADSYCEDLYAFAGLTGHRRGYHTLMVDLPGQVDTPPQGLHFMYDYERPVREVVNHLVARPEVAVERIAIIGFSAGSYVVTRAAGFERRIKACIANTPVFDIGKLAEAEIPRALAGSSRRVTRVLMRVSNAVNRAGAVNLEKFLWQAGTESLDSLFDILRRGTADLSKIECAYFSMVGEGDPSEAIRQAEIAHKTIESPIKAYRLFTEADGAEAHCQVSNLTLLNQGVYNWLDAIFSRNGNNSTCEKRRTEKEEGG